MAGIDTSRAESIRRVLTEEEVARIQGMYRRAAQNVQEKSAFLATFAYGDTENAAVQSLAEAYLKDEIVEGLAADLEEIAAYLEGSTPESMRQIAAAVADDVNGWGDAAGVTVAGAYAYVPNDVVEALVSGQVYDNGWNLSSAIWGDHEKTLQDIYQIVAEGVAENRSSYDIAKALEQYVSPDAAKPWDWSKVYPGTKRQVDYNAQRLARTLRTHAYQQSWVRTTRNNPFIEMYRWEASNSDRTCEICAERDGQLYAKNDLPIDHPNGMCTWAAEIPYSMDEVSSILTDWYYGTLDDADMQGSLDLWFKDMAGESTGQGEPVMHTDSDWRNSRVQWTGKQ